MSRPRADGPPPATARPPARRLGREQRRLQIVDAARAEFLERGFAGARTQQIAERAAVNQALLYKHFTSKQALFEAAVLEPLEAMIAELTVLIRTVVGEPAPAERRHRFEEMHALVSRTCVAIVPLLGVALFAEGGQAFYRDRLVPLLDRIHGDTDELLASWPVRQPLDGRTAFTMTFGMHLGLALDAHMRGEPLEVERVSRAVADVVVRGLSQPADGRLQTGRKR
ncbi:MAG: TetR/AcrR family transcriptional regulator [Acidimicrobiia bacterium]